MKLRTEIEVQLRNRIQRRIEFQQQHEEKVARLRKELLAEEEERQKVINIQKLIFSVLILKKYLLKFN